MRLEKNDIERCIKATRIGMLCWNYREDGTKDVMWPTKIWFTTTAWKEPLVVSCAEDWISTWKPLYTEGGFFEQGLFSEIKTADDIDAVYWNDEFWKKQNNGICRLLELMPIPIDEETLMDIVSRLKKEFAVLGDNDYWWSQRNTEHFWIKGLLQYISMLQYKIGYKHIEKSNAIIRSVVPTLIPYMDNQLFLEKFFKPNLNR